MRPAEPDRQAAAPERKEGDAGARPGKPKVQQLWWPALCYVWPAPQPSSANQPSSYQVSVVVLGLWRKNCQPHGCVTEVGGQEWVVIVII